ncbi:hypothetical protein RF11_15909 [Thelohanellus kitauei]|uniref:FLYWCH-type domain-containing protein n=1 Tax=Thelohanellus kitauei TaxID=669202 RepID=A0A0C2IIC2_THEKT|nr:hypothetical protein RF11_15908 [Thelohanellus kitauei]KII65089.1 hypothetical protein RF11_15909 [Thelohanellus kitauei]
MEHKSWWISETFSRLTQLSLIYTWVSRVSERIYYDDCIYHAIGTKNDTKYFLCKNYKTDNCKARIISKCEGNYILKGRHECSKRIDMTATPETLIENYVS